jgi:hypothetical protein
MFRIVHCMVARDVANVSKLLQCEHSITTLKEFRAYVAEQSSSECAEVVSPEADPRACAIRDLVKQRDDRSAARRREVRAGAVGSVPRGRRQGVWHLQEQFGRLGREERELGLRAVAQGERVVRKCLALLSEDESVFVGLRELLRIAAELLEHGASPRELHRACRRSQPAAKRDPASRRADDALARVAQAVVSRPSAPHGPPLSAQFRKTHPLPGVAAAA